MMRGLAASLLLAVFASPAAAAPLPPCAPDAALTIAAVGDVLVHPALQEQAWSGPEGFAGLWAPAAGLIARADIAYANLEGPMAWGLNRDWIEQPDPGETYDDEVYTGYRRFNYHPRLAVDLRRTGFDIVSTANNHAIDRGPVGIDRTIDALELADLDHVGTRRAGRDAPWFTITEARGWRVAWVACAAWLNYIDDTQGQVLECGAERAQVLDTLRRLRARDDVHLVILTPHWGAEHQPFNRPRQTELAREAVAAGADVIIGNHPHVLQPWVELEHGGRRAQVLYSIGNFVSHQQRPDQRASAVAYLGFVPGTDGRLKPGGLGYVPLHTRHDPQTWRYVTGPLDAAADPEAAAIIEARLGARRRLSAEAVGRPGCGG